jgi:hypothetical protein
MQAVNDHRPGLNKRIFWDVDFEKLDFDKRASFIIERVFEREVCRIYAPAGDIIVTKKFGRCLPVPDGYPSLAFTSPALYLIMS